MPNFRDCITDQAIFSSDHFSSMHGATKGDFTHGLIHPEQMLKGRTLIDGSAHATPVKNLYICGSSCHPGPGLTFLPGYNCGHEVLEKIFSRYPELRFTLDIAHAHIGTNRNRSPEFIKRFASKVFHVHMSDNYGREDNHLPIGAGMIYFGRIFKELKMIGYNETITLEVFSRDRDYLKMSRSKVTQMWDNA